MGGVTRPKSGPIFLHAAVAYHGGDTEKYLGEVGGLHAALLMHLGEEDEFISKTAQAEIKAALAKKPNATDTAIRVSVTPSPGTTGYTKPCGGGH